MSRAVTPTSLEWLDTLPSDWAEREIGREVWVRARVGWKGLTADEYVDDGIPMLATPDIKGPQIAYHAANKITVERFDESPEIKLRNGDVLLTKDGNTIGTVNVVRALPSLATVNGSIAVLTPLQELDGRFLYWFIASSYAQSIFDRLRGGMGVPHLFQRDINRIRFPYPPLGEQRAIADYLDRETARIDTLIEEQQRLIEMLRERRGALISHAVLDATSKRVHLRRLVDVIDCAHVTAEFVDDDRRFPVASIRECQGATVDLSACNYTTEEFFEHLRAGDRAPRVGDLLFIRNVSVGLVSVVTPDLPEFAIGQETVLLRRKSDIHPAFLRYALVGAEARHAVEGAMIGSTFRRINVSAIRALPMPTPPIAEQRRVVRQLDEQTAKIDLLIAESERLVELSRERRAALITAAVTGQIDLREVA